MQEKKNKLNATGSINAKIVGKTPSQIAELAGFECSKDVKILIGEVSELDVTIEPFAHEKLSPILAMYKADNYEHALEITNRLVVDGGIGHTSVLYVDPVKQPEKVKIFKNEDMPYFDKYPFITRWNW